MAATPDRHSHGGVLLIGLKFCDCKTGFTVTVERYEAKRSNRLTKEDLCSIGENAWLRD